MKHFSANSLHTARAPKSSAKKMIKISMIIIAILIIAVFSVALMSAFKTVRNSFKHATVNFVSKQV
ncbi:MAG: hypothetical protein LBP53_01330 [Candidatus Peribacteria bacterium]|nr:hypothetical protein [Candidatus Peribacteria bacterium]